MLLKTFACTQPLLHRRTRNNGTCGNQLNHQKQDWDGNIWKCVYLFQEFNKVNLTQDPYNDNTSDKDFDKQWPIIEKQQHYNKRP